MSLWLPWPTSLLHFNHVQIKFHCGCHDLTSLKHVTKNSNLIKIRYLLFLIVVFCVWLFGNTQTTNNISYEVMSGNLSLLTTNNISYEVMSGNLSLLTTNNISYEVMSGNLSLLTTNNISYEVMSGNLSLLTTNNISYEVMSGNLSFIFY